MRIDTLWTTSYDGAPRRSRAPERGDNMGLLSRLFGTDKQSSQPTQSQVAQPQPPHAEVRHAPLSDLQELLSVPSGVVHVFPPSGNDPAAMLEMLRVVVATHHSSSVRIAHLKGPRGRLIAVFGPESELTQYQARFGERIGPLAAKAGLTPQKIRPDETIASVASPGNTLDPAPFQQLLAELRTGAYVSGG